MASELRSYDESYGNVARSVTSQRDPKKNSGVLLQDPRGRILATGKEHEVVPWRIGVQRRYPKDP